MWLVTKNPVEESNTNSSSSIHKPINPSQGLGIFNILTCLILLRGLT